MGLAGYRRAIHGRLIAEGILSSEVGQTYPLEQFREALAQSTRPGRGGKVLLAF